MQEKKSPRISMTAEADFELKLMAVAAGISRGHLIGQMVKSLAARLQKLRKEAKFPGGSSSLVPTCIQMILLRDSGAFSDEEFERQVKEFASWRGNTEWTSDINDDEE